MSYPAGYKPRYWTGEGWVHEEFAEVPYSVTLAKLPSWAAEHGIPDSAELSTREEYGQVSVVLIWLVPDEGPAGK